MFQVRCIDAICINGNSKMSSVFHSVFDDNADTPIALTRERRNLSYQYNKRGCRHQNESVTKLVRIVLLCLINSCKIKTPPNQHKTRKLSLPDTMKAPTQPLRSLIRRFLVVGLGQNSVSYF